MLVQYVNPFNKVAASAPVLEAVGVVQTGAGVSATTANPSGTVSGSFLVCLVQVENGVSITTPTGWTSIQQVVDGFGNSRQRMMWRVANGSATDTPTVALGVGALFWQTVQYRLSNVHATPINTSNIGSNTGGTTPAVPTITTTVPNCLLFTTLGSNAQPLVSANPSTWGTPVVSSSVNNLLVQWAKGAPSAGSYGGETTTISFASATTRITVAFAPP